MCPVDVLV